MWNKRINISGINASEREVGVGVQKKFSRTVTVVEQRETSDKIIACLLLS